MSLKSLHAEIEGLKKDNVSIETLLTGITASLSHGASKRSSLKRRICILEDKARVSSNIHCSLPPEWTIITQNGTFKPLS